MTVFLILVGAFIIGLLINHSNESLKKDAEEIRKKQEEEELERVMEAREKLRKQIEDSYEEDLENAKRMEGSNLGRYSFMVKGLTYRSRNDQVGSLFLRQYCTLHLVPEPENEYDKHAVKVYSDDGNFFLGYVERDMSFCISCIKELIVSCFISSYKDGETVPYITATAYFQMMKDGELIPYKLGETMEERASELRNAECNNDNTVTNYRTYISKALKKDDWTERTFNEVQGRVDFLMNNNIRMTERLKEELRARGIHIDCD